MSQTDRIKEEIGWLKLIFAGFLAIDISLAGWLAQNYQAADTVLMGIGRSRYCCRYHSPRCGKSLCVQAHGQTGEPLMVWFVVVAVVVFIGGMLIVAHDAITLSGK